VHLEELALVQNSQENTAALGENAIAFETKQASLKEAMPFPKQTAVCLY
jgi:hypothetical protein